MNSNDYRERIDRLVAMLPEEADGAIVTSQVNRHYLTGYDTDTGWLIVTRKGAAFVTDFRYIEAANAALEGVCVVHKYGNFGEVMRGILDGFDADRLLVERERLFLSDAAMIAKSIAPHKTVESQQLDEIMNVMRVCKNTYEMELCRAAQVITENCLRDLLTNCVREGVSERELALELEFKMRRSGAQRVAFDLIVAGGANSSMPHAVPGDYRIKNGDFITFDIGSVVGGYHSDMTRTVALGNVSDEMRKVYNIVLKAQLAGVEYLTSGGTDAHEADKIARDIIAAEGYGDCFGHSLGHGVGLEIHETPRLAPQSKATLTAGNIVTVEPGIYLEGKFGVRIEDMLYITEDSAINLASFEKELIIL